MQDASPAHTVVIVERDVAGDAMVTWSFPSSSAPMEAVLAARSLWDEAEQYSKHGKHWIYTATTTEGLPNEANHQATGIAMHVISRAWQPEAWLPLSKALLARYVHTGEPTDVLAAFLSAARKDTLEAEGADISAVGAKTSPVPIRWTRPPPASPETLAARSRVGTVAQLLGEHIALLWTAVMLRRRVLVHAPRTRDVLLALGAAPLLAPHRQEAEREHCRPLLSPGASRILALPAFAAAVEGGEGAAALESRAAAAAAAAAKGKGEGRPAPAGAGALGGAGAAADGADGGGLQGTAALAATRLSAAMVEAADLARAGWYVAGTTDPGLAAAAPAAWDLYVDLPRRRCVVGEGAGASFRMTVLHKRLVQAVQGAIREGRAAGAGAGSGGLDAPVAGALQAASSSLVQRLKRILAAKVTRAREAAEAEGRELEGQRASLAGVLTPGDLSAAGLEGPVLGFLWEVARAEPDIPTAALGATQVGEAEEDEGVGEAAATAEGAGASGGGDAAAAASPAS